MINSANYYEGTTATFRGCSIPKRKPDYISKSGSRYWYGEDKKGTYVIRHSNHWIMVNKIYTKKLKSTYATRDCKRIATCLWKLKTNTNNSCGKCYMNNFIKKRSYLA